jgi:hypothetical protein
VESVGQIRRASRKNAVTNLLGWGSEDEQGTQKVYCVVEGRFFQHAVTSGGVVFAIFELIMLCLLYECVKEFGVCGQVKA